MEGRSGGVGGWGERMCGAADRTEQTAGSVGAGGLFGGGTPNWSPSAGEWRSAVFHLAAVHRDNLRPVRPPPRSPPTPPSDVSLRFSLLTFCLLPTFFSPVSICPPDPLRIQPVHPPNTPRPIKHPPPQPPETAEPSWKAATPTPLACLFQHHGNQPQ